MLKVVFCILTEKVKTDQVNKWTKWLEQVSNKLSTYSNISVLITWRLWSELERTKNQEPSVYLSIYLPMLFRRDHIILCETFSYERNAFVSVERCFTGLKLIKIHFRPMNDIKPDLSTEHDVLLNLPLSKK